MALMSTTLRAVRRRSIQPAWGALMGRGVASGASTVDRSEVDKFNELASDWWAPHGRSWLLHRMQPVRAAFIRQALVKHGVARSGQVAHAPLTGLRIADVGCGAGIATEGLARLGAQALGIDAASNNVAAAKRHAAEVGLDGDVEYRCTTAEELVAEEPGSFDVVVSLEVIEHVADKPMFVESLAGLLKPNGLLFMSTINRTFSSYALAVIGAEYVARLVPAGTHEWQKFVTPKEAGDLVRAAGLDPVSASGVVLDPMSWEWRLDATDLEINYIFFARKGARES